jgi:predicted NUDIX family NTP pyrophosphohydrolase
MEWPPHSGIVIDVPELDRVAWFGPDEARLAMNPAQAALIDRLLEALGD